MSSTRIEQPQINEADDTKPSVTAFSVAMSLMRSMDTKYGYLFSKEELELTRHLCTKGKKSISGFNALLAYGLSAAPYSLQTKFFNAVVIPGYDQLILLRKLLVKNRIETAINNGAQQIVFVGGGYDIRAIIASLQYPEVRFYELDRGPTRETKIDGIRSIPEDIGLGELVISENEDGTVKINDNLYYVKCDLSTQNAAELLTQNGFIMDKKTMIIAEGLTMYLTEAENQQLLISLSEILNEGDQLLLSFMTEIEHTTVSDASLKSSNESYRFSLPPDQVISFVKESGYSVDGQFHIKSMLGAIGDDETLTYINTHPERPTEYYFSLRRSSVIIEQTLDEVPFITFNLAENPNTELTTDCVMM